MTLDVAKTAHAAPPVPVPLATAAREKPIVGPKLVALSGTEEPREGDAPPEPTVSETTAEIRDSRWDGDA